MAGHAKFHPGQRVWWTYRTAKGYGVVDSILAQTGDPDSWRYKIKVNAIDRAAHKGEPEYRTHTGGDMHPWDGVLPAAVVAQAKANRS